MPVASPADDGLMPSPLTPLPQSSAAPVLAEAATTVAATAASAQSADGSASKKLGEPHRIYWQQWIVAGNPTATASDTAINSSSQAQDVLNSTLSQEERPSRRELITSSAAVRLSRSAKAIDLTNLLRQSLQLPQEPPLQSTSTATTGTSKDCLVLVGSIYSFPRNFVQFQHEREIPSNQQAQNATAADTQTSVFFANDDPFHIVRTLRSDQSPLQARDEMQVYLNRYVQRCEAICKAVTGPSADSVSTTGNSGSSSSSNNMASPIPTSAGFDLVQKSTSRMAPQIAPKLQWYYVPANVPIPPQSTTATTFSQAMMPNCVELDGYCTAMENDDDNKEDDGEDDNDEDETATTVGSSTDSIGISAQLNDLMPSEEANFQQLCRDFPWLVSSEAMAASEKTPSPNDKTPLSRRMAREARRSAELNQSSCYSGTSLTTSSHKLTGYLLKQDAHDAHVWRRVYCTLTANDLWFVSRIYYAPPTESADTGPTIQSASNDGQDTSRSSPQPTTRYERYSKHGRIRLTRALLVEPTAGYAPLFRTPHAFELVSSRGTSHVFRAQSRHEQRLWITAVSNRIVQSYERSLLQHADLIVRDECLATSRRTVASAVTPLWTEAATRVLPAASLSATIAAPSGVSLLSINKPSIGNSIGSVLRWGMDVALFRDRCRYIGSSMPSKSAVVVVTPPRRRFFAPTITRYRSNSSDGASPEQPDPVDAATRHMIRATWDHAAALLARATTLALTLQVRSSIKQHDVDNSERGGGGGGVRDEPVKLSHGVDALCRHIDFVITGRSMHDKSSSSLKALLDSSSMGGKAPTSASTESESAHAAIRKRPPPEDLFDNLLVELQSLAALADRRIHHREQLVADKSFAQTYGRE